MAKENISVSVSKEVLEKFREVCSANSINKSKLIEKLIVDYINGEGKNEE